MLKGRPLEKLENQKNPKDFQGADPLQKLESPKNYKG